MQGSKIIREVMELSNFTQTDLQKALNLKSQSSISAMLRSDMRISTFVKILQAMGCTLTVEGYDKQWTVENEG